MLKRVFMHTTGNAEGVDWNKRKRRKNLDRFWFKEKKRIRMGAKVKSWKESMMEGRVDAWCPSCVQDQGTLPGRAIHLPGCTGWNSAPPPTENSLLPRGMIESVRGESYPEWRTQESLWAQQDPGKETDGTTWSWHWNISQRTPVCRLQGYLSKVVRLVRTHQFILAGLSRQSITAGWDGTNKTSGPASLTKTHCLKLLGLNFHLQGVQQSDELQFWDNQH